MNSFLQKKFPLIRTREEILSEIAENERLKEIYGRWKEEQREEFLNFCTGVKGVKLLYDTFFKQIMNPDTKPERLEGFISEAIGKKVKILHVLPNESAKIAVEDSLMIMDIVVQLEDGSIANVEVQKIGYLFSGQRSACYSADLLIRQYKRQKEQSGKYFTYKDIKSVYTVILFEKSEKLYHEFSEEVYIHHSKQCCDTGLEVDLLQEYTFICLDIFKTVIHNKDRKIANKLEEWLVFLSEDDPEMILRLLETAPEFGAFYEEVYELCRDTERMMEMYSKELQELDRNTVRYMVDEMQKEITEQKKELESKDKELESKDKEIVNQRQELESKGKELESKDKEIEELKRLLREQSGKG